MKHDVLNAIGAHKASPATIGSFALVLHSHIPYVLAHGRSPHGTDWLSEVAAETYIPLLDVLDRLAGEGISAQITIGITPILTEQLANESFCAEFDDYLAQRIAAAQENQSQFKYEGNMHMRGLALYWEDFYTRIQTLWTGTYGRDIIGAFRRLQDNGHIEIVTSAATHGYLPLLLTDESVQAQIKQGVTTYKKHYGRQPNGFWLPECAYRPRYAWNPPVTKFQAAVPVVRKGIEEFLAENGIEYFFVDAHLLKGGRAIGVYADRFAGLQALWSQFSKGYVPEIAERTPYAPYLVNSSGTPHERVAVFSRDHKTGQQVWSGEHGYPGDAHYLEFHKKHYPGNLRYWRISEDKVDLGAKRLYEPYLAQERINAHAEHFVELIHDTLTSHLAESGNAGVISAMYDTELYGHWWFEGPEFLYQVLKRLHSQTEIAVTTCRDYLHAHEPTTVVTLPEGSWGEGGYHWIWLNEWTAWTWEVIYKAETEIIALAQELEGVPQVATIVKQAARELLLLQSSDWQFSISTFSSRDYAEQRVNYHADKFTKLAQLARKVARLAAENVSNIGSDSVSASISTASSPIESITPEEWNILGEAEDRDRCFPDIDPAWWAKLDNPVAIPE